MNTKIINSIFVLINYSSNSYLWWGIELNETLIKLFYTYTSFTVIIQVNFFAIVLYSLTFFLLPLIFLHHSRTEILGILERTT